MFSSYVKSPEGIRKALCRQAPSEAFQPGCPDHLHLQTDRSEVCGATHFRHQQVVCRFGSLAFGAWEKPLENERGFV